jgi:hypothetical protein
MSKQSYAERVQNAEVMLAGIKSHKETLSPRGINDQYIEKFEALTKNCVNTNNTQEKAKADLMALTRQLEESLTELEKELQFCKRVVKTDIPKSQWKEFGMQYRYGRKQSNDDAPEEETKENES